MKLYQHIAWSAIYSIRCHNPEGWRWMSLIFLSVSGALWLLLLAILLVYLRVFNLWYYVPSFSMFQPYHSLVGFALFFFLPSLVANYYYVFSSDRYLRFGEDVKAGTSPWPFLIYFLGSLIAFWLVAVGAYLWG